MSILRRPTAENKGMEKIGFSELIATHGFAKAHELSSQKGFVINSSKALQGLSKIEETAILGRRRLAANAGSIANVLSAKGLLLATPTSNDGIAALTAARPYLRRRRQNRRIAGATYFSREGCVYFRVPQGVWRTTIKGRSELSILKGQVTNKRIHQKGDVP